MALFEVLGNPDPVLRVTMDRNESIFAESGAMMCMDSTLELTGRAAGGIMQSLKRKLLKGESFFQQNITSKGETGQIMLAPIIPGDIKILKVGESQYRVSDGAYLANTSGVVLQSVTQGLAKSLFGKTGGFFILESTGSGDLAVSGFGSIHAVDVKPGSDLIVDNGHVIAWDSALDYKVSITTNKSSFFKKIISSQTSGEGLILRFKGQGKVFLGSRNQGSFLNWISTSVAIAKHNLNTEKA